MTNLENSLSYIDEHSTQLSQIIVQKMRSSHFPRPRSILVEGHVCLPFNRLMTRKSSREPVGPRHG